MAIQIGVAYPVTSNISGIALGGFGGSSGYYKYKTNADGSIGVDYFFDGRPVTNQDFRQLTGADTTAIENGTGPQAPGTPPPSTIPTGPSNTPAAPKTLSAGEIDGIIKAYDMSMQAMEKAHTNGILSFNDKTEAIKGLREGLSKDLKLAMGENRGYFSSVSPNAYQSQKKNYDSDVQDQYKTGEKNINTYESQLARAKDEWETNYQLAQYNAGQTKNALLQANTPGTTFDPTSFNISSNVGSQAPVSAGASPFAGSAARVGGGATPIAQQASVSDYNAGSGAPIDDLLETGRL